MATNQQKLNVYVNKLLSSKGLGSHLLSYLESTIEDTIGGLLQGNSGVLSDQEIQMLADGNDQFKLDLSNANRVAVGTGQVITLTSDLTGTGGTFQEQTDNIKFPNLNGTLYDVGIKFAEVPRTVEVNSLKGIPEYGTYMDTYGEVGVADSVTNQPGSYVRLRIDNTTGSLDYTGRIALCWLTEPVALNEADAFYLGVIARDGTGNYIDIPYSGSNGPLGQNTATTPPSTTNTDYNVWVKGPTLQQTGSNMQSNSEYAYIGRVTGSGPSTASYTFSYVGQSSVFLVTRDKAYDALGTGAGRIRNIDAGAVEDRYYTNKTALNDFRPDLYHAVDIKNNYGDLFKREMPWGWTAETFRYKRYFNYLGNLPSDFLLNLDSSATATRNEASGLKDNITPDYLSFKVATDDVNSKATLFMPHLYLKGALSGGMIFRVSSDQVVSSKAQTRFGLRHVDANANELEFGFILDPDSGSLGQVTGYFDGDAETFTQTAGVSIVNPSIKTLYMHFVDQDKVMFWSEDLTAPLTLTLPKRFDLKHTSAANETTWKPFIEHRTKSAATAGLDNYFNVFYVEYWRGDTLITGGN